MAIMQSLKNAIEDIVVVEVIAQLSHLPETVQNKIDISEVSAYALNRLPPLYATTSRGWTQQRQRAETQLKPEIVRAVEQAFVNVRIDRPQATMLDVAIIDSPADALARLRTIFALPQLQWQEVPQVILEKLFLPENPPTSSDQTTIAVPPAYYRQGASIKNHKLHWNPDNSPFESYMVAATCTFTNVLETLVWEETKRQTRRMTNLLSREVTIADAAAYTLNRLPPMYATTQEGLERQRHKALSEMGNIIGSTVIEALMTLSRLPRRIDEPIPLLKFEEAQEEALKQVRSIAQRNDITWRNITKLLEDAWEASKAGNFQWRLQWQTLGKLYDDMGFGTGDAEFNLLRDPMGDILLVQVNNKRTLSTMTDNPKILAEKALKYFPNLDCIELWSPLVEQTLNYTKAEMIMDGVIPL